MKVAKLFPEYHGVEMVFFAVGKIFLRIFWVREALFRSVPVIFPFFPEFHGKKKTEVL
jgi:hypothetical protein